MNSKQFSLLMCLLVSLIASSAAVLLKLCVFHIEKFFFEENPYSVFPGFKSFTPIIGIGISVLLILKVYKRNFIKGNDTIIYAMIKKHSNLPFSAMYSPLTTSAVTVGLGGSAGLESPIVASGAAIGSNMGRIAFMSQKDKTLLIGCGAAAGISTAFSAPIAGVLFALEVLMIDLSLAALVPLLIAAIIGTLLSSILLGGEVVLFFDNLQPFNYSRSPYYLVIGILCGLISIYYTKMFGKMAKAFSQIKSATQRWIWGGLLLGALIFLFPALFGEGYLFIKSMTQHNQVDDLPFYMSFTHNPWLLLVYSVLLILFKVFATGFTTLSGGNGGSFAPALFIGALVGFVVSKLCELGLGQTNVPVANFIVAGMAGVLSGIFYAPLTAIFLSAEITNGYPLFIPLMIVSTVSYLCVKSVYPLSMETLNAKTKAMVDNFNKDYFVLSNLSLENFLVNDYPVFLSDSMVTDLLPNIQNCTKMSYPIVNDKKEYIGVITINRIKNILLPQDANWQLAKAKDIMDKLEPLKLDEKISQVLERFKKTQLMELPVVDQNGQWLGFVQENKILEIYRKEINLTAISEM